MKILNKTILLAVIPFLMVACSKPDISGVWIPEKHDSMDLTYKYYEIGEKDSSDRYSFTKYIYIVNSPIKSQKLPLLNGKIQKN